jgi:hypothetical protein
MLASFAILTKSGQTTPLISCKSTLGVSIWFHFCLQCFSLKSLFHHSSFCVIYLLHLSSQFQYRIGLVTWNLQGEDSDKVGEYWSVLICIYSESKKHHFHIQCDKGKWKVISAVQRLSDHNKIVYCCNINICVECTIVSPLQNKMKQYRQYMYSVSLMCICATTVAVEKQ